MIESTVAACEGLNDEQVATRTAAGQVNTVDDSSSRTLLQILRGNIFTLFNAILSIALVAILLVGTWKDAMFGFVLVFNTLIGAVTEYRAKFVLDRLAILHQDAVHVVRGGAEREIDVADVVLDDVIRLNIGDQVPADGEVLASSGLELDESMLTGESDPVHRDPGDEVLSGSAVTAGTGLYRATAVGDHAYAQRITAQARRFSLVRSELRQGINKVLVFVSWIIVPVAILLFWSQIRDQGGFAIAFEQGTWREAAVQAIAGIVGMVPEGLVLLTSMNFALAALILARHGVLTQELPAVEVLARVDVLCLDKTGTITDGTMALDFIEELSGHGDSTALLKAIVSGQDSPTTNAISAGIPIDTTVVMETVVPFSSARKWSSHRDGAGQVWYFGAPEVLLATAQDAYLDVLARVQELSRTGARVLLLACGQPPLNLELPPSLEPASLVVVREKIRDDAAQTLEFFSKQGLEVKIISGDNPATVGAIASQVGLEPTSQSVDARILPESGAELEAIVRDQQVFGRVSPEQKRSFVHILQSQGRTVAMTGDGVNDALALKDADLGIAMASGSPATKAVARLVLLNDEFSALPPVLGQGRRVIANLERVATLFLTKTTYAVLLAFTVIILSIEYPFLPRHLTLVSVLTIGVPAFFLALAPNNRRYRQGFLDRVLRLAIPGGVVIAASIMTSYLILHARAAEDQANTGAAITLLIVAFWLLGALARPWLLWRVGLVLTMVSLAIGAILIPAVRDLFALVWPEPSTALLIAIVGIAGITGIEVVYRFYLRHVRHEAELVSE